MPKRTDSITRLRDEICHYCGNAPGATLDHIIPDLFGGAYRLWNLVPACQPCNHAKGSSWPTCECEKCQLAIARHIGDPVFRQTTMKVLDRQERSITQNAREVREKADLLEANVESFKAYRQSIESHLTDHAFTDSMES